MVNYLMSYLTNKQINALPIDEIKFYRMQLTNNLILTLNKNKKQTHFNIILNYKTYIINTYKYMFIPLTHR